MKAIVQERYGSPDVLELREMEQPVPADNEVLVRVHAAALNARDWHVMRGDPYLARLMAPALFGQRGPKRPIRGSDVAGTVEAVGRAVTRFRAGDEVYGDVGEQDGAFAEYVCAREDRLAPKPANLTFAEAAAVPLAGNTALQAIRDAASVRPGHRVLINGASGGVGTFAVQLAKLDGAEVTAVCSTRNVDLLRSLGADRIVDYTREDFSRTGERYDVVLDLVGNRSLSDLRRVLTRTGTLVLSGGGTSSGTTLVGPMGLIIHGSAVSRFVRHRIVVLQVKPSRENLLTLKEIVESGGVTPVVDRTFSLPEVPDAIRYLENEHARAKVVVSIVD